MEPIYDILKLIHIVTIAFMSAPLYNLIVVSEKRKFGAAPLPVDRYFENIIRGTAKRCYVFQTTALVTGVLLVILLGQPITYIVTNWALFAKSLLLLTLMGLLSTIHFRIQPRIDRLISSVSGDSIPQEVAKSLRSLRTFRTRLAATCLFLVITTMILALQIYSPFPTVLTLALLLFAAAFAWRVYKTGVPYGWV